MASNPTLPTLDGEPRELREGDRVLWSDDVIDTVKPMTAQLAAEGLIETTSRRVHSWTKGIAGPTIVLILGPAEQDNGDGTLTKPTTVMVTMGASLWDEFTPVAYRDVEHREMFLSTPKSAGLCKAKVGFDHHLILRPKTTTPSPFEVELARRVSSGAFVLPPDGSPYAGLVWRYGDWWWSSRNDETRRGFNRDSHGPLPDRQQFPGPDTIQLDAVRRLAKQQEPT